MSVLKALHVGQNLDDLFKMTVIPAALCKKHVMQICKSAQTVLREAEKSIRNGDEEMAYVFLMKYFNLLQMVQKRPDYIANRRYVQEMLGGNHRVNEIFDQLEQIKKSLEKRYDERNQTKDEANPIRGSVENNNTIDEVVAKPRSMWITCNELKQFSEDNGVSMLIMDCRPRGEFSASRLVYKEYFNVPEEIIKRGLSAERLAGELDPSDRNLWASRHIKEYIILMDHSSKEGASEQRLAIHTLRDILMNWDPNVSIVDTCLFLIVDGGFENFQLMYPMMVTDPHWRKIENTSNLINLSDIVYDQEYDSVAQIKMKDERSHDYLATSFIIKPIVNRKLKPAAEQKYSPKQKEEEHVKSLLAQEKQNLYDKLVFYRKKAIEKEAELSALLSKVYFDNDARKQADQISNDIMELDDQGNNASLLIEQLDRDLEKFNVRVFSESIDIQQEVQRKEEELWRLDEERKAIQMKHKKEREQADLIEAQRRRREEEEEQERVRLERERQKEAAKEAELQRLKLAAEEQARKKVIQPSFDRAAKPKEFIAPRRVIQNRNFNQEYGSEGKGLTGLKNLGNTCYMNSVIQCLLNIEPLRNYLNTDLYLKHIDRKSATKGQIVEELAAVSTEIWCGRFRCITPRDFRIAVGDYKKEFSGYEQQDSHEFLTILMDILHQELQTISQPRILESAHPTDRAWYQFTEGKESNILNLFYGQIKSTVKCVQCEMESSTYESFSNLSLELPSGTNLCELKDCLDLYFDGERINDWDCPRCKGKREAVKKLIISKLPPVLVIHFKRFFVDYGTSRNVCHKKQTSIAFPLVDFDVKDYLSKKEVQNNKSTKYNLSAVSNHFGSTEKGHYTAFCKNAYNQRWYKFDDQDVRAIRDEDVASYAAYILFYIN